MSPSLIQRHGGVPAAITHWLVARFFLAVLCVATACSGANVRGQDTYNAIEGFRVQNVRHALDDGIQLGASHSTLAASGQWVDVSWQGVQYPQDDDFIALYAPANVSAYHTSPVKYKWAVSAPSHRKEGAGSVRYLASRHTRMHYISLKLSLSYVVSDSIPCCRRRFRLLNLRCDMRLAFVRNGFEFPVVAAWGDVITVENPNEPLQGHLALTGKNRLPSAPLALAFQTLSQYTPNI